MSSRASKSRDGNAKLLFDVHARHDKQRPGFGRGGAGQDRKGFRRRP